MNFLDNLKNWPFLQEPLWRWFIFLGALIFLSLAWRIILGHMKGVA